MTNKLKFKSALTFINWFRAHDGKNLFIQALLSITQTKSSREFLELGYSMLEIEATLSKPAFELIFEQLNIDPVTTDATSKNLLDEGKPLVSKSTSKTHPHNNYSRGVFPSFVRDVVTECIIQYYGTMRAYIKTDAFLKRRLEKSKQTNQIRYGVDNPGQLPEHKEKMAKGIRCENPFASNKFRLLDYIKGKRVLPEQLSDYELYKKEVLAITERNRSLVEFNGTCYYTGQAIYKCYGKENIDRNSWNCACLDHKISIIYGFFHGISPEIVGGVENLCWTSRFFNSSIKKEKTEAQVISEGIVSRYIEVLKELEKENEGKDSKEVKK